MRIEIITMKSLGHIKSLLSSYAYFHKIAKAPQGLTKRTNEHVAFSLITMLRGVDVPTRSRICRKQADSFTSQSPNQSVAITQRFIENNGQPLHLPTSNQTFNFV
ncbi:hypothetical protein GOP47_0011970 [Adiantum capillus-veneris]|uniref:Uncharacterized protein n=1 Tax=Adiantum capillus-veneris TaxID=13818 RepID=A0A9D4ZHA5_ADICA|nr:hypothetical protein GOP47_0011970 [Adiantum capillus-veneris]